MSDLLIRGMEMPKDIEPGLVIEFADGIDGKRYARLYCYRHGGLTEWLEAVTVPAHGRLIDADELKKVVANAKHMDAGIFDGKTMYSDHLCNGADYDDVCTAIDETPTIVPAEPCNNLSKPCKEEGE